jgi:enolase
MEWTENDWEGWNIYTEGAFIEAKQVVGDDLFVTNDRFISQIKENHKFYIN